MSNHTPLTSTIPIVEEHITSRKRTITKNSKEEDEFIKEVITFFSKLDTLNILDIPKLEKVVLDFANIVDCYETLWTLIIFILFYFIFLILY